MKKVLALLVVVSMAVGVTVTKIPVTDQSVKVMKDPGDGIGG